MAVFELDGFIGDGHSLTPFFARITEPQKSSEGDYFCTVHAPSLFERDKDIYGTDEDQAKHLALRFLASMLGGRAIYDKERKPITLQLA